MKSAGKFWLIILFAALTQSDCVLRGYAQDALRDSVRTIHSETQDREFLENENAKVKVQDYDRTAKKIESEMVKEAQETAVQQRAIRGRFRYGEDEEQQARADAKYIDAVYRQDAEAAKALARQRQLGLEQSAVSLEEQLLSPTAGPQGTRLQPLGTNLYVRNYYVSPPAPIIELVATQKALHVFLKQSYPYINASVHGKLLGLPPATTQNK